MGVLVDGYNLLNCGGILVENRKRYSLEASRLAVVKVVRSLLSEAERSKTTVVFDGREAPPGLPKQTRVLGIDVRYSPRGEEADDLLERLIEADHAPRQLTVVSSDHRVQRAARRRRAVAIDSEVWLAERRRQRQDQQDRADSGLPPEETPPGGAADFPPEYLKQIQASIDPPPPGS